MVLKAMNNFFDISSTYNYWVELCSLVFLCCLLVRFLVGKKFLSKVNIIFGAAIVCGIFDLSFDILGSIFLANYESVSLAANFAINELFYFFHIPFPVLLFTFLLHIAGVSKKTFKKLVPFYVPAILYLIIILLNPFTHWVFSIDYSATDGVFKHGPLFIGIYIVTGFYIIATLVSLFKLKNKIEKPLIFSMIFSVFIVVVMIVIQILYPQLLLTGLAISLSCWANYEHLANAGEMTDKSSGLFNYNAFLNYLKQDIRFSKKQNMIICDVSSITEINARLGILMGNHVYKEIGNFFKKLDNGKAWSFRLFGPRFVIVFKDSVSLNSRLDDIESRFDKEWKIQDNTFDLSISGYVINGDLHAKSASDFFDYLNTLDNKIKSTNKSFVRIDQKEIEAISRVREVELAVKRAMDRDFRGFEMHYQPIYHIASKKFNHAEALLRFTDDELGPISPAEFIPIVESRGLAHRIDRFVLHEVCQFLSLHPEIETIDVNISAAEFINNPSREFMGIINKFNIQPNRICFEVTETATVEYPQIFEEFMKDMTLEGFTFAVDDFGTGYSNISRIVRKDFSIIKLDRFFLNADSTMKKVLEAVIDLLHKLGIPAVIEGVETKEQLDEMAALGIQYVQGWYFSKALPKDEFIEFINNQK
ncbi:MAG: GGDEF domain-containing phosphodiesterase [Bacilli bacterium]|nr:GGDEF domain-containing phosphodiesterase [Bacilli bacterium]